jgi:hypothetical protein
MSSISAIGAQPSLTQATAVRAPSPTPRPVDSDGDHDGSRAAPPPTKGAVRVTA